MKNYIWQIRFDNFSFERNETMLNISIFLQKKLEEGSLDPISLETCPTNSKEIFSREIFAKKSLFNFSFKVYFKPYIINSLNNQSYSYCCLVL